MKLFLIRHGEKEGHGFSAPLTNVGKEQIKLLSSKIKELPVEKVFSSANPRSIESAQIICEAHKRKFEIIENLREFDKANFYRDISMANGAEYHNYLFLKEFLKKLEETNKNTLLVMNAGLNRAIICTLLGLPIERAIALTQNFASITELERKEIYGKKIWCINSINTTYE